MCILIILAKSERNCSLLEFLCYNLIELGKTKIGGKSMRVVILENASDIAVQAGNIFVELLTDKPNAVLGLATGATPVPTYKYLIDCYKQGKVSFKDAVSFNLDEYVGFDRNNVNSYYYFMMENLFNHVDMRKDKVHVPNGVAENLEEECARYDAMIEEHGGIDVQLLGIGTNGHIGFNEPSDAFSDGTYITDLAQSTIESNKIYFTNGDMPTKAITMGIGSIMKAKKIILIATGISKAKAIKAMIEGEVTPACPASILQKHDDAVIFLDKDAASLLA